MRDVQQLDERVAAAREDQLARWQRGDRVVVEFYLSQDPNLAADADAALDLIYSEVLLREEFDAVPETDEYIRRFPQHAGPLRRQFALHAALSSLNHAETDTVRPTAQQGSTDTDTEVESAPALPGIAPTLVLDASGPAAMANFPTTQREIGGYEILAEIGRGGMGVVYKGRHRMLGNRIAALKVLRPGGGAADEDVARFHLEAKAVAHLNHEHIVPVYEFGTYRIADSEPDVPFVALEYVGGGSLAQKIAGTPLSPRQAAEYLLPLAEAMEHAHRQGIVHRDLKPANVLLTDDGKPKITDFGLAKTLDADTGHTRTGAIMGTPSYMAPEQAAGKTHDIGPAADVWSLGAILYEMLTGRPPFKADTILNTLQQVASLDPVPPARLQPNLPRDLETICLKCLQKERKKRYASAGDLADDLRRFLHGEPIMARPISFLERSVKWVCRRPAAAALLAVSAVAFAALIGVWVFFTVRLHEEQQTARREATEAVRQSELAAHWADEAAKQCMEADDQKEQALKEAEEARRQAERAAKILRYTLASVDDFAMKVRSAKMDEIENRNTGYILFKLACSYSRTSAALTNDKQLLLKDRAELAEQYAKSAVRLLECAKLTGFFEKGKVENRNELKVNKELEAVREREDFRRFVAGLE